MTGKEMMPKIKSGVTGQGCSPSRSEKLESYSRHSSEEVSSGETCRVCQCLESDKRGEAALEFLGIALPLRLERKSDEGMKLDEDVIKKDAEIDVPLKKNVRESRFVEIISPDGEVLFCRDDLEMGLYDNEDTLVELGCSCKNDLALVHYPCALKWFVNHGSTVCEICGNVAKNIRSADLRKVIGSLKEYEALRERTASGEPIPAHVHTSTGVDPDAVAAIRRQRLSEISLWFGPHNNVGNNNVVISEAVSESSLNTVTEEVTPTENPATKWAVEGTGILLATGLLTVTMAWLIAPHVGKKTARSGLHILLGGICALTVVVFFRFFVLTRIKYGPARYWAILFLFWFLVFGIWASRAHGAHST